MQAECADKLAFLKSPLHSGFKQYIQLIPGDMRLRNTIPDTNFRITNFDSVNLCTSEEHFHTDF
jgi:hypothetical protein